MSERLHVLLVEDNLGDARLLREYLNEAGLLSAGFKQVGRLAEACAYLEESTPDVILLDLSLPDAHGMGTLTQTLAAAPTVPIIVLTGLNDETVAVQAVQSGAQDYLIKGHVDAFVLGRSIRYAIERMQLDRERSKLLRSEQAARSRAEAAVRARDEILRVVSHDLGNSIAGIYINTTVLLRTVPDTESMAEVRLRVEGIRDLTKQMQRLRRDLLDVAVIEAGELSVTPEPVEAPALVATALGRAAPLAVEKSLVVEAEVDGTGALVHADAERVLQVLDNLLGNAIKFTPSGGRIAAGCAAAPGGIRFWVQDSGPGIAEENLERVFDRFWKVNEGNRSGAGLGLAISKGIVEAHEGRIWVESEPGRGSQFCFVIPCVAQSATAPASG
jgi:signal transduction histidine kinase